MIKPWWRFVPLPESTDPSVDLRLWLNRIDRSVDWTRFQRFFRWLDPRGAHTEGHPPIRLFKALLIQQWYAMVASEYDYFVTDSIACRRFVGLRGDDEPPTHLTIASFRLLLVERGVALDVYTELARQLEAAGLSDLAADASRQDPDRDQDISFGPLMPAGVQPLGPPEWRGLESALLGHWQKIRRDRKVPKLADIRLHEVPEIQPQAALIRFIREQNDFRYEFVGPQVVEGNGGDATGTTVNEKVWYNRRNYGRAGLQSDLAATYAGAIKHCRPASISAHFVNVGLKKCEIWGTVAPLTSGDDGDVDMLLAVALIKPILLN